MIITFTTVAIGFLVAIGTWVFLSGSIYNVIDLTRGSGDQDYRVNRNKHGA